MTIIFFNVKIQSSPFPQTSQVFALDPSWTARCRRNPVFVLSTFEWDNKIHQNVSLNKALKYKIQVLITISKFYLATDFTFEIRICNGNLFTFILYIHKYNIRFWGCGIYLSSQMYKNI